LYGFDSYVGMVGPHSCPGLAGLGDLWAGRPRRTCLDGQINCL